jgi:hypothetical protein
MKKKIICIEIVCLFLISTFTAASAVNIQLEEPNGSLINTVAISASGENYLSGYVYDKETRGTIDGAYIYLKTFSDNIKYEVYADSSGYYIIEFETPGKAKLWACKENEYIGSSPLDITLTEGQNTKNFYLKPLMREVHVPEDVPEFSRLHHTELSWAVNAVRSGGTVYVSKGKYYGPVCIKKPVKIIGDYEYGQNNPFEPEPRALPQVTMPSSSPPGDYCFKILSDDVTIQHLYISELGRNSGVKECTGIEIEGIPLESNIPKNCIIKHNFIEAFSEGIHIGFYSKEHIIEKNWFVANNIDVIDWSIGGNTIESNIILNGIKIHSDCNNIINNPSLLNIYGDQALSIIGSKNIIKGNNIGDEANPNKKGIEITTGSNNEIYENTIHHSTEYGVYISGLVCDNKIYHNNFKNNKIHAFSEGIDDYDPSLEKNKWDNGKSGNYWDDRMNNQGGPNTYMISGDNQEQDNHPLLKPYMHSRTKTSNKLFNMFFLEILKKLTDRFPLFQRVFIF